MDKSTQAIIIHIGEQILLRTWERIRPDVYAAFALAGRDAGAGAQESASRAQALERILRPTKDDGVSGGNTEPSI